ncbi:AraC family transcriptional regulator [Paenibacillus sp. FA6]|uniref:AraC family transcriptional regulator n=1 Tax=Paenibacillus sp. FA6 TaxID=3413029 RepID=UPI003F659D6F
MRGNLVTLLKRSGWVGKGSYFRKSLILVLIITSIPSLFIAISNYLIGINQIEKEVFNSHRLKIEQFSEVMNKQFDQMSLVMSRWSTNPLFGSYLDRYQFIDHIDEMHEIMQTMLVVGGSNVLIDNASLFLSSQQALVSADGINYVQGDLLHRYRSLLHHQEGLFMSYHMPLNESGKEAEISVIFKLPWHSDDPFGAFVLHLSPSEVKEYVSYMQSGDKGTAFLMRKSGEWVTEPAESTMNLSIDLRNEVLKRQDQQSSFPLKWKGETYMVSFGEVTRANWIYVTASPLSELTEPVAKTSRWILACSMVGLIVAFLLAWFASSRLYRPIRRLVSLFSGDRDEVGRPVKYEIEFIEERWLNSLKESESLQERLKLAVPSLREGFMLQLVQGHLYASSEAGLLVRMESLGWEVTDRKFSILLIQLSGLNEEAGRFKENDRQLITFAAANIAEEISANKEMQSYSINFQNLSVGLLCSVHEQQYDQGSRDQLHVLSQELISTLSKVFHMHVTVIVCKWTDRIGQIPELLEQARQTVKYRDLQEVHQVIDMEEFEPQFSPNAQYPFVQEKEFLHVMRLGMEKESYHQFAELIKEIKRISDQELMAQQTLLQLLGSVRHTLIELGFTQHPLFTEGNLYEEMIGLQDLESMSKWFRLKIIAPYLEEFILAQNIGARRLIEQVTGMMKEHYMEDVSLEGCAEQFHTSPYTLSRSFKQILGINYVDYMMSLRMEKAKELLTTTHLKINEVAERVGYQHSYFNKIFKGETGLTPTQYRSQFRKLD